MKIFHVITKYDLGGAERVAINIAMSKNKDFVYHLFEVIKGDSDFTQEMINQMLENNIIVHRSYVKFNKLGILLFPLWFCFSYLKHKPDIIHTHTEVPDLSVYLFYLLIKPFRPRVQFVRTIHNTQLWNTWVKIGLRVEKFFMKQNSNIAISAGTKERYMAVYNNQTEMPIIFNGVEEGIYKEFGQLVHNKINVLFAGRFEYQKGIDEMIEVIRILEKNEGYYFHVVGEGSLDIKVQNQLSGRNNVTIYSKIYNLSHYISSFDYLFMPSNFEGLSLMSIEASMNRTPVIINSCLGLEDTLPLDWPLKVSNNSVDEFINIFNEIIPRVNYQYLIDAANKYAKENFSLEEMQNNYELLYYNRFNSRSFKVNKKDSI